MALLSLFFAISTQATYTPAYLPSILTGSQPETVLVRPGNFRGYRPIHSTWSASKTMAEAYAAGLAGGETFLPSTGIPERSYKILSDRIIEINYSKGKRKPFTGVHPSWMYGSEVTDIHTAVTCSVTERPLLTGALPSSWFADASVPSTTPADFAGFPTSGISGSPTAWYQANDDPERQWYYAYWAFEDQSGSTFTTLKQQLQSNSNWAVDGEGAASTAPSATTYAFITFFEIYEFPELPSGWRAAKVGWGDPNS